MTQQNPETSVVVPAPEAVSSKPARTRFSIVRFVTRQIGRLAGWTLFAAAWTLAQIIRLVVDIKRRKAICHSVTERAAVAVGRSWTVRIVSSTAVVWSLYKAFMLHAMGYLYFGLGLLAVMLLAEAVWAFVLYVAAMVSRLDATMEQAVEAVEAKAKAVKVRQPRFQGSPAAVEA